MGGPGPAAGRVAPRSGPRPGQGDTALVQEDHPGVPAARPLFGPGPLLGQPAADRGLVALSGSAARALPAPAQPAGEDPPHRHRMVAHPSAARSPRRHAPASTGCSRTGGHQLPFARRVPPGRAVWATARDAGRSGRERAPPGPRLPPGAIPAVRAWRETPSRSATTAADTPWTNRLAAASRRRSKTDCWGRRFGSRDNLRRLILIPRASHPPQAPSPQKAAIVRTSGPQQPTQQAALGLSCGLVKGTDAGSTSLVAAN
jgi:hypothetical protein